MLPITVDLARIRVMLVGEGMAARRRLALLDEAGAGALTVYAPAPAAALAARAGARLRRRLPRPQEIARAQLVFVAGMAGPAAAAIARTAAAAGVLITIEDDLRRSDFHSPAVLRRGDLTVAISTAGRCPGLAALLRGDLERHLGPEWAARVEQIARLRAAWRKAGAAAATVRRWTAEWAAAHGWFADNRRTERRRRARSLRLPRSACGRDDRGPAGQIRQESALASHDPPPSLPSRRGISAGGAEWRSSSRSSPRA
jgi:precorrin-2 dehydrogenase/sirohydrochlorin ferrochelatase